MNEYKKKCEEKLRAAVERTSLEMRAKMERELEEKSKQTADVAGHHAAERARKEAKEQMERAMEASKRELMAVRNELKESKSSLLKTRREKQERDERDRTRLSESGIATDRLEQLRRSVESDRLRLEEERVALDGMRKTTTEESRRAAQELEKAEEKSRELETLERKLREDAVSISEKVREERERKTKVGERKNGGRGKGVEKSTA